jgi:HlyD family secretion protein
VGGKATLRRVAIGEQNRLHAEVKGGLAPGDRVILHPGDKVVEGVAVQGE